MLRKIISGAQTGVDRAALMAAKDVGLETGGMMPSGFKAQDGNHPEFRELYNIVESKSSAYPPRTKWNVMNSDGTMCIAKDFYSPGEILTRNLTAELFKPRNDIDYSDCLLVDNDFRGYFLRKSINWIEENRIEVLNIAGNSERTAPGIQEWTYLFLIELFQSIKWGRMPLQMEL